MRKLNPIIFKVSLHVSDRWRDSLTDRSLALKKREFSSAGTWHLARGGQRETDVKIPSSFYEIDTASYTGSASLIRLPTVTIFRACSERDMRVPESKENRRTCLFCKRGRLLALHLGIHPQFIDFQSIFPFSFLFLYSRQASLSNTFLLNNVTEKKSYTKTRLSSQWYRCRLFKLPIIFFFLFF